MKISKRQNGRAGASYPAHRPRALTVAITAALSALTSLCAYALPSNPVTPIALTNNAEWLTRSADQIPSTLSEDLRQLLESGSLRATDALSDQADADYWLISDGAHTLSLPASPKRSLIVAVHSLAAPTDVTLTAQDQNINELRVSSSSPSAALTLSGSLNARLTTVGGTLEGAQNATLRAARLELTNAGRVEGLTLDAGLLHVGAGAVATLTGRADHTHIEGSAALSNWQTSSLTLLGNNEQRATLSLAAENAIGELYAKQSALKLDGLMQLAPLQYQRLYYSYQQLEPEFQLEQGNWYLENSSFTADGRSATQLELNHLTLSASSLTLDSSQTENAERIDYRIHMLDVDAESQLTIAGSEANSSELSVSGNLNLAPGAQLVIGAAGKLSARHLQLTQSAQLTLAGTLEAERLILNAQNSLSAERLTLTGSNSTLEGNMRLNHFELKAQAPSSGISRADWVYSSGPTRYYENSNALHYLSLGENSTLTAEATHFENGFVLNANSSALQGQVQRLGALTLAGLEPTQENRAASRSGAMTLANGTFAAESLSASGANTLPLILSNASLEVAGEARLYADTNTERGYHSAHTIALVGNNSRFSAPSLTLIDGTSFSLSAASMFDPEGLLFSAPFTGTLNVGVFDARLNSRNLWRNATAQIGNVNLGWGAHLTVLDMPQSATYTLSNRSSLVLADAQNLTAIKRLDGMVTGTWDKLVERTPDQHYALRGLSREAFGSYQSALYLKSDANTPELSEYAAFLADTKSLYPTLETILSVNASERLTVSSLDHAGFNAARPMLSLVGKLYKEESDTEATLTVTQTSTAAHPNELKGALWGFESTDYSTIRASSRWHFLGLSGSDRAPLMGDNALIESRGLTLGLQGEQRSGTLERVSVSGALAVLGGEFVIGDLTKLTGELSLAPESQLAVTMENTERYTPTTVVLGSRSALTLSNQTESEITFAGQAIYVLPNASFNAQGAPLKLQMSTMSVFSGATLTLEGGTLLNRDTGAINSATAGLFNQGHVRAKSLGYIHFLRQNGLDASVEVDNAKVDRLDLYAGHVSVADHLELGWDAVRTNELGAQQHFIEDGATLNVGRMTLLGRTLYNAGDVNFTGTGELVLDMGGLLNERHVRGVTRISSNTRFSGGALINHGLISMAAAGGVIDFSSSFVKVIQAGSIENLAHYKHQFGNLDIAAGHALQASEAITLGCYLNLNNAGLMSAPKLIVTFANESELSTRPLTLAKGRFHFDEVALRLRTDPSVERAGLIKVSDKAIVNIERAGLDAHTSYALGTGTVTSFGLGGNAFVDPIDERGGHTVLVLGAPLQVAAGNTLHVGDVGVENANDLAFGADSVLYVDARNLIDGTAAISALVTEESSRRPTVSVAPGARLVLSALPRDHGRIVLLEGFDYSADTLEADEWLGGMAGNDAIGIQNPTHDTSASSSRRRVRALARTTPDITVDNGSNLRYLVAPFVEEATGSYVLDVSLAPGTVEDTYPNVVIPTILRDTLEDGGTEVDNDYFDTVIHNPDLSTRDKENNINSVAQLHTLLGLRAEMLTWGTRAAERAEARLGSLRLPTHAEALWVTLEGGLYRQGRIPVAGHMNGGYRENSAGITLGADRMIRDKFLAGAAVSVLSGNTKSVGDGLAASGKVRSHALQLYGAATLSERLRLLADAGLYEGRGELDMPILLRGMHSATADVKMRGYWASARAEMDFDWGAWQITPHIGARFVKISDADFTTKINHRNAFQNHEHATRTWQVPFGVRIAKDIEHASGWKLTPAADLTITTQFGDRATITTVRGASTGTIDDVPSNFAARYLHEASFSLAAQKNAWHLEGAYRYSGGDQGRNDHRLELNARYLW